jgi:hypothetical protein
MTKRCLQTKEGDRPSFLTAQPWLVIEVPKSLYYRCSKCFVGVVGDGQILHKLRLDHIEKGFILSVLVGTGKCLELVGCWKKISQFIFFCLNSTHGSILHLA